MIDKIVLFLFALALSACEDGLNTSTTFTTIPESDSVTGTLLINDQPHDVVVVATYSAVGEDSEPNHYVRASVHMTATDTSTGTAVEARISIPFEEGHYPDMPLNLSSYRYDRDGEGELRPLKSLFTLVWMDEDYLLHPSSGTATINFDLPNGELTSKTRVPFTGNFENIILTTLDGAQTVEVSGSFEELGYYSPATTSSRDSD